MHAYVQARAMAAKRSAEVLALITVAEATGETVPHAFDAANFLAFIVRKDAARTCLGLAGQ